MSSLCESSQASPPQLLYDTDAQRILSHLGAPISLHMAIQVGYGSSMLVGSIGWRGR
jgi:hypothetical protein